MNSDLDKQIKEFRRTGDETLLGDILLQSHQAAMKFLLGDGWSEHDAQDLASDCIVVLQTGGLNRWDGQSKFTTFLFAIAHNKSRNLRRGHVRHFVSLDAAMDTKEIHQAETLVTPPSFEETQSFIADYRDTWSRFLRICRTLCLSSSERVFVDSLNWKLAIPENMSSFLAFLDKKEGADEWKRPMFSSREKAILFRLLARGDRDFTATSRPLSVNTIAQATPKRSEFLSTLVEGNRLRAEIWLYWASKPASLSATSQGER